MLTFRQCFLAGRCSIVYSGTFVVAALHLLIYFNSAFWNALSSEAYKCTVKIMICFTFVGVYISA